MSTDLRQAVEQVARRFRRVRLLRLLALCWLAWALIGLGLSVLLSRPDQVSMPGTLALGSFAVAAALTAVLCAFLALRSMRDPQRVARRIEARHPELGTALLAAVEQDAASSGRLGFLQSAVIAEALQHRRSHDWKETVSSRSMRGAQLAHALALGLLVIVSARLISQGRERADVVSPRTVASVIADADLTVEPGDTEIERGATLLVVARFGGAVPADARLVVEDGAPVSAPRGMTRSLEDPTFAGRVELVGSDLAYRVEFEGRSSKTYHVRVFEYPEWQRADAKLVFPRYTALEPKTVEDIRHVTAVEGTELTLNLRLNKEVAQARLVDDKGQAVPLARPEDGSTNYRATFPLSDPRRFKVELVDREGRKNKPSSDIVVNVTRNKPAVVKLTQPGHDVRVSPVEELTLRADLEDDFGLVRHGLSYSIAGQEPKEIVLSGPEPAVKRAKAEHLLAFESLKAVPDQLVTYFFWAEDVAPDNQPRRTSGDMYFAEVRHFEEIFRQGEQPPGGSAENEDQQGQGNAQASEKLADLQKEIINGTWKLIRRETATKPSDKFAEDGKLLQESQQSAIEQAAELAEKLQDPTSKANLDQATRFMKDAETHLTKAARASSMPTLRTALTSEQAAYQALLKLRAREFEVIRNNSRQRQQRGQSSAGSPSQRQLNQLELSNEENRYEEQRSARAQQDKRTQREKEQAETRQVVNRLRELAQRQTDLNDRVKELQSALEAAKTPQAREEIERQLKRLRDQQQQILRDTDELQERMESEENRERMAEARQQVEESREHVRQASEALEEGRLPQAVTEGARAGRQLNDLREELRKGASDWFAEEMTDMRNQARTLDEDQKKLTEQLDAWNKRPQQTLREAGERQQVKQGLEQQGKRLDQILDRMRETTQQAEETEPLLARNLFDTVKKATEQRTPDALKVSEQLVEAGVPEDAARFSRRAGEGIEQLRQGVERAAESVLGDETAALKRAQGELEDLADQVNREIARATGTEPPATQPGRDGQDPSDRPRTKGQAARRKGQQGEQEPQGEGEPGQQKGQQGQGQGQPGQQKGQRGQAQQKGRQGQGQGQPGQQKGQQGQGQGQGEQAQRKGQQGEGQAQEKGQQGQGQGQQGEQPGQGNPQGQGQQGQGSLRGGQGTRQAGSPNGGGGGNGPTALDRMLEGAANRGPGGPITGEGFRQWSDRLRDVEELLENPELRAEAADSRSRRGVREEFKRHAKEPDWNQLKGLVAEPIRELRDRVAEEVRRRESPDSLVPIDRDPVPPQYSENVRRYYERLGSGR